MEHRWIGDPNTGCDDDAAADGGGADVDDATHNAMMAAAAAAAVVVRRRNLTLRGSEDLSVEKSEQIDLPDQE